MKSKATHTFVAGLLLAFSISTQAAHGGHDAATQSYAATIGAKAGTGIVNTASGWIEIPKTMITTSRSDGVGMGLTAGFFKGLANMLGRTVMGVVDLATFPIPTKPMVEPAAIWQRFDEETSFNNTWEMYDTK